MIISPTRLIVHVPSDNASQSCLIFLLEQEPNEEWMKGLSNYEGWDKELYNKWLKETKGKDEKGLIALMEFSKET